MIAIARPSLSGSTMRLLGDSHTRLKEERKFGNGKVLEDVVFISFQSPFSGLIK
jgi:hypothetical protein